MNRRFLLLIAMSICGFANICNAQSFLDRLSEGEHIGGTADYRMLVNIDAVKKELAIKPEQLKKLEQLFENTPSIASAKDKRVAMQKFEANLQEILDAKQWNRCVELRIQKAGSASLVREDVVAKLKLSEKQIADLRKLRKKEISAAFSAGFKLGFRPDSPSPEELKKSAEARRARQAKSLQTGLDILTKTQRDQFEKLRGELFAFPKSDE